jgi:predicted enzyme related to lactoylglutathione lyase
MPELAKPSALQSRGGVWFACGEHQFHVGIAEPFAPAAKAHPALSVRAADLDRVAQRLAEAGSPVQWDEAIPGTRRFYTADPWGNRIELVATD